MKSWSHENDEVRVETFLITLIFDMHLDSNIAEMPVEFQSDTIIIQSNAISQWLGANLESALKIDHIITSLHYIITYFYRWRSSCRRSLPHCQLLPVYDVNAIRLSPRDLQQHDDAVGVRHLSTRLLLPNRHQPLWSLPVSHGMISKQLFH